jgi:branched-chain amino acid transport system ATP-binding protein
MSPLLEVRDLSVAYGHIQAVRGLSLSVNAGRTLALLGANGAGKTSTVEAIAGFNRKAGGTVRFSGRDISRASPSQIARLGLALVSQWRDLFPTFSVEETLRAAQFAARDRGSTHLDDIYGLFPKLAERRRQLAGTLSGGEQQMLALGRALAARPLMLLLDEPTAGLAAGIVNDVMQIMQNIRAQQIPILLVEQNIEVAAAIADDCVVLSIGSPVWSGTMKQAAQSDDVREIYFGTPTCAT